MSLLRAQWGTAGDALSERVGTASSTRNGGVSGGLYRGLNLATHVGDDADSIAENRRRFASAARLPSAPLWLDQVHGSRVIDAAEWRPGIEADGIVARRPGIVCAVLTADCLPVLFANRNATVVAAAHAGWRGLAAGVLAATVARMGEAPGELLAWLGPAIGQPAFEVGDEVRAAFLAVDPAHAGSFERNKRGRWQADLYGLARRQLAALGLVCVTGGGWCTHGDAERFFSHRREAPCGRQASAIWLR
jgi:YfiH family protein